MLIAVEQVMLDIGQAVIVDRAKRAIAFACELFLERNMAEEWLARAPDIVTEQLVSWARMTPAQIDGLFDLCGDAEGAALFAAAAAQHPGALISLFWRHEREVAHGQ